MRLDDPGAAGGWAQRIRWPVLLSTLFAILLGWYLVYTQSMVRALRANAETLTEVFSEVNDALIDPDPLRADDALFRLNTIIRETGIPMVLMGPQDTVLSVENLPFEVDVSRPEGQDRVRQYVRRLDQRNPPVGDVSLTHLHFGDTPEVRSLRWIPWLQVVGLLLTVLVGFTVIRSQRRAEAERAWTSMARELAHQLGTPISSLQGWLEVMRLPEGERPGDLGEGEIAAALQEDLHRLERVSHRFELIGREPELEVLSVPRVVGDLERYLQSRLPRFGQGVRLRVDIPTDTPPIRGNEVLLAWALENVVKNALDALAGTGGRIEIRAGRINQWVTIRISDTGPGVDPEIRDRIFDPGVTTKSGGWGVGLALSRRIVEGVHKGRIELLDGAGSGATFLIYLPAAV
ncbi:MAG TPA: HAMP domain-containing sensor histidine kinase [Longimicrobiales bacterium]|nr:HAMP domain-containing sensor histidine kinase [Longimicrobiales bacterium]